MKKFYALVVSLVLIAAFGLAMQTAETMTLKGDVIDNMCATANKAKLGEFVESHTKACALMPNCVASGYSLYVDGKLHKFDKASNAKIEEFLNKPDSKLQVVVTVKKMGEELSLVSVSNQE